MPEDQAANQSTYDNVNTRLRPNKAFHPVYQLLLCGAVLFTILAWYLSTSSLQKQIQYQFNKEAHQIISAITKQLAAYENILWASVGTVQTLGESISDKKWQLYVKNLDLANNYPAISSLGIIYNIPPQQLKSYIAKQKNRWPSYKIYPSHTKYRYFPITYIYPLTNNEGMIGLDMAHEIQHYQAILQAEKSHLVQMTQPLMLTQQNTAIDVSILFAPFYKKTKNQEPNSKPVDVKGLIYAPIIAKKLINQALAHESKMLALNISDGKTSLYNESEDVLANVAVRSPLEMNKNIMLYGQNWLFNIKATKQFIKAHSNYQPLIVLFGGIIFDFLLLYLFMSIAKTEKRAIYYANQVTQEIKNKNKQLQGLVLKDSLTLLMNRKGFFNYLPKAIKRAVRNEHSLAVFYLDLDDFKNANDQLGHKAGDELLISVSEKLTQVMRDTDFLARIGGDEFALIIEDILVEEEIGQAAERIVQAFAEHQFIINAIPMTISISIGIAVFPHAGTTAEALVQRADIAMYRAKKNGKNNYAFYSDYLDKKIQRQHKIEQALSKAVVREEFELFYQAQTDLNSRSLIGMEVLIRWHNKKLNNPSPDEFIKIAESSRLIIPIGQWILDKAIHDYHVIEERTGLRLKDLSVNISAVQLIDPSFYKHCCQLVKKDKRLSDFLLLEITETSLLNNIEQAKEVLNKLDKLHFRFALDDFGTGYSSLNYLKHLPFSVLKIDQSFVRDIGIDESDMSIIQAIISLSKRLGLYTIAEGIETREQYEFLQLHGCNYGQGYLMSKPLPLEQFIEFALNWKKGKNALNYF